jgi:hypothetical protein
MDGKGRRVLARTCRGLANWKLPVAHSRAMARITTRPMPPHRSRPSLSILLKCSSMV